MRNEEFEFYVHPQASQIDKIFTTLLRAGDLASASNSTYYDFNLKCPPKFHVWWGFQKVSRSQRAILSED